MGQHLSNRRTCNSRRALVGRCSLIALALFGASRAYGQDGENTDVAENLDDETESHIIVLGNRALVATLEEVPVEQTYDETAVKSYAVGTIGELLDEIRSENGDGRPSLLVNGQPVANIDDVSGLPVEVIARVEAFPRGAAQRLGGGAGQRAYNIVLKPVVTSATLTASRELATEGGWHNDRGEGILTYIRGQDRINASVRLANSGNLFESERGLAADSESEPYSVFGNIVPFAGEEVDPAFSALASSPVTQIGLNGAANPTLEEFLAGANRPNPAEQSTFRTLRGASRPLEVSLAGNKTLTPWLSLSFNARASRTRGESFNGLPTAYFRIDRSNAYSPFTIPVLLALEDPARPLRSQSKATSKAISSTLNASFGDWRTTLAARWDVLERRNRSQFAEFLDDAVSVVGVSTNPFDGSLVSLIAVGEAANRSRKTTKQVSADAEGPLFKNWAGPVRARLGATASWLDFAALDRLGARSIARHEYAGKAGLSIPLTSKGDEAFWPSLGDSEIVADVGRVDLGRFGALRTYALAFNWQVRDWLRFVATSQRDEGLVALELLAAPELVTSNVPYFDPLVGETVPVTTIFNGAGDLRNESTTTKMLSWTVTPAKKYRLRLSLDYVFTNRRNQIDSLPPPTADVVQAFADRFVRDANGTLVFVDNRLVNFSQRKSDQIRLGAGFTIPVTAAVVTTASEPGGTVRREPPVNLQVNLSYTYTARNKLLIREGLPEIDLLGSGAPGIIAGQQRNSANATFALTKGGTGIRGTFQNRGARYLATGTADLPNLLTFEALSTLDLKFFTDLGQLFPDSSLAKDTRITVSIDNLYNDRQRVYDLARSTPLAYLPARLDNVGRTVSFELRKVF